MIKDVSLTFKPQQAHKERITFNDAPYITTVMKTEAILVTEDKKLQKIAGKSVKTTPYSNFEKRL